MNPPDAPRRARWPGIVAIAGAVAFGVWALRPRASEPVRLEQAQERVGGARGEGPERHAPALAPDEARPEEGTTSGATPRVAQVLGVAVDRAGLAVVGAEVSLHALDAGSARGLVLEDGPATATVTTGADGAFELPAPAKGLGRVRAAARGRATLRVTVTPAGARLRLVLAAEATLAVRAIASAGAAPGAGRVEVELDGARLEAVLDGGAALVERLPAGDARVRVLLDDGRQGMAGPYTLTAGTAHEAAVLVRPASRIAGQVRAAEDDAPLPGASVVVAGRGRAVWSGTTDAEGRFGPVPAGLPDEPIVVSAAAPGRRAALLAVPALSDGSSPLPVVLRLEPADAWTGRVEQADGRAAEGVDVGYTADGVVGREPARTRTDAEGRFTLPPPPPPAPGRRVVLVAEGPGGHAALALRPDTPRPDPLLLRLSAGATVRGRVVDATGAGLPGVTLRASPSWRELRRPDAELEVDDRLHAHNAVRPHGLTALTDASGRFAIPGLAPGPWTVSVEHEGESRQWSPTSVRIETSDVDLGGLTLGGGHDLEGEVVRAADGAPLPGARVHLTVGPEAADPRNATTDADGRFRFRGVPAGAAQLSVLGTRGTGTRLEVPHPGRVTLTADVARRLSLEVQGPAGPYEGWLALTLARGRAREPQPWQRVVQVKGGRATVDGVPLGTWWPSATADGLTGAGVSSFHVQEGHDAAVQLALQAAARLAGTLRDTEGRPVAGGEVQLRDERRELEQRTHTDAEGRWTFDALTPGDVALEARGAGGAPVSARATVRSGATESVDLRLAPAGALRLTVLDAQGRPVANALLAVRAAEREAGGPRAAGSSDARGRARFADLAPGAALVSVRARDGREATLRVDVAAGSDLDLEIRLPER